MGDSPAITPAHALGTNRTVRVFHSGQSPRPHWWPSWEGLEVFFSSARVRVMSGVVPTEEKTAGWVSKTWDPALCPVPSLLVTPVRDPQFLRSLLKCAAPGLGCAALSSLSDEAILSHLRTWPWAQASRLSVRSPLRGLWFQLQDPEPGQAQWGCLPRVAADGPVSAWCHIW